MTFYVFYNTLMILLSRLTKISLTLKIIYHYFVKYQMFFVTNQYHCLFFNKFYLNVCHLYLKVFTYYHTLINKLDFKFNAINLVDTWHYSKNLQVNTNIIGITNKSYTICSAPKHIHCYCGFFDECLSSLREINQDIGNICASMIRGNLVLSQIFHLYTGQYNAINPTYKHVYFLLLKKPLKFN